MATSFSDEGSVEDILRNASEDGDLFTVQRIVDAGSPLAQEILNRAASAAAYSNHVHVVRFLLERGASPGGWPLFSSACGKLEMFQAMYDYGWHSEQINEDMKGYSYMLSIISNLPVLEWLLDHGMDPNLPGDPRTDPIRGDMTPLNAAAFRGRYDEDAVKSMELLIARGAVLDPFVLNNAIGFDLHERGKYRRNVLQWLVDHGANVNFPTKLGTSILYAAVAHMDTELVAFLLEIGADPSLRALISGMTALERARAGGLDEIGDMIESYSCGRGQHSGDLLDDRFNPSSLSLTINLTVAV